MCRSSTSTDGNHPRANLKEFARSAVSSVGPTGTEGDGEVVVPTFLQSSESTPLTEQERRDWAPLGGARTDTTTTFCGTAEYLVSASSLTLAVQDLTRDCLTCQAPEVIQGLPYSYPVDWWALGTMLFEMLIGIVSLILGIPPGPSSPCPELISAICVPVQTPFYASNHTDMYTRVLHDELVFPDERPVDQDTKSLIRGVSTLQSNIPPGVHPSD